MSGEQQTSNTSSYSLLIKRIAMLLLQSNDNMELTSSLESERHANRDIGQKLSDTTMELAETKQTVCMLMLLICAKHK